MSHREAGRTAPIHIRPRSGSDKFGAPPHSRSRFSWWYIQWRSQGGHGAMTPPKLLVNVFFWRLPMHFRLTTLNNRSPKCNLAHICWNFFRSGLHPLFYWLLERWHGKNSPTTPPHQIGGDGKFLLLPPPPRIWSAAGDHGKGGPPKKNHGYAGGYITTTKHMSDSHILKVTFQDQSCETFLSTPRMLARTNTSQNNLKNM